jgi:uncharacterized protein (DUF736 family)
MAETKYEQRDGTGSLFKNDEKLTEAHPDYKGSCMIDGKKLYISAWIKESKEGMKYMSLSIQPPLQKSSSTKPAKRQPDNEDIPF